MKYIPNSNIDAFNSTLSSLEALGCLFTLRIEAFSARTSRADRNQFSAAHHQLTNQHQQQQQQQQGQYLSSQQLQQQQQLQAGGGGLMTPAGSGVHDGDQNGNYFQQGQQQQHSHGSAYSQSYMGTPAGSGNQFFGGGNTQPMPMMAGAGSGMGMGVGSTNLMMQQQQQQQMLQMTPPVRPGAATFPIQDPADDDFSLAAPPPPHQQQQYANTTSSSTTTKSVHYATPISNGGGGMFPNTSGGGGGGMGSPFPSYSSVYQQQGQQGQQFFGQQSTEDLLTPMTSPSMTGLTSGGPCFPELFVMPAPQINNSNSNTNATSRQTSQEPGTGHPHNNNHSTPQHHPNRSLLLPASDHFQLDHTAQQQQLQQQQQQPLTVPLHQRDAYLANIKVIESRLFYLVEALNGIYGTAEYDFSVLEATDFVLINPITFISEINNMLSQVPQDILPYVGTNGEHFWRAICCLIGGEPSLYDPNTNTSECDVFLFHCPSCDPAAQSKAWSNHYLIFNKKHRVILSVLAYGEASLYRGDMASGQSLGGPGGPTSYMSGDDCTNTYTQGSATATDAEWDDEPMGEEYTGKNRDFYGYY